MMTAMFRQNRGFAPIRRPRRHSRLRAAFTLVCTLVLTGCATVAPYERERLAKPDMAEGSSEDARAGQDHATAYREGSTGASGGTGAGCGCN